MIREIRQLEFVRALTDALRARGKPQPTADQIRRAWRSGMTAGDAASVLAMGR